MPVTAEDMEAARNLIARQKLCVDDQDLQGVTDCWARDARQELRVNGGAPVVVEGREAIMALTHAGWRKNPAGYAHMITTLEVKVGAGEQLLVDHYCAFVEPTGDFAIMGYGRYKDRLVREDGAWRIAERVTTIQSKFQAAAARMFKAEP